MTPASQATLTSGSTRMPPGDTVRVQRPLEPGDDRRERVQQVDGPQMRRPRCRRARSACPGRSRRVHDRRHPEPHEQRQPDQVLHVAVPDVQRRDPERQRRREHHERRRTTAGTGRAPRGGTRSRVDDDEEEQHRRLQHEVHERRRRRPTAAGSREGTPPSSRGSPLSITRPRAVAHRHREQVPCEQAPRAGTRGSAGSSCPGPSPRT